MAFGQRSGDGGRFRDINVTPLVDVMLVLLVVFMITAPLLASGLRVELPSVTGEQKTLKDTTLIVTITRDERVMLGERDITDTIESSLASDASVRAEGELYIRADRDARYGIVARVVAAARAAGVGGLNLLVDPTASQQGDAVP